MTSDFQEGVAHAADALIDVAGRPIHLSPHRTSGLPSEGFIQVQGEEWKVRFLDWKRRTLLEGTFDQAQPFSGGLAMVKTGERYGYIDRTGAFVIPPKFLWASSFSEGFASVIVEGPCLYSRICDGTEILGGAKVVAVLLPAERERARNLPPCRYALIDRTGKIISDRRFDDTHAFSEGLASVHLNGKWGYADRTGEIVLPWEHAWQQPFSEGLALVATGQAKYGYIDRRGHLVIATTFDNATSFHEGSAKVSIGDQHWFIDRDGHKLFDRTFRTAFPSISASPS